MLNKDEKSPLNQKNIKVVSGGNGGKKSGKKKITKRQLDTKKGKRYSSLNYNFPDMSSISPPPSTSPDITSPTNSEAFSSAFSSSTFSSDSSKDEDTSE